MISDLLEDALYYVDRNEVPLVFETICDHIDKYNIPITEDEYGEAM
ncbi:MAG: MafI family immunity protein [Burkholderiales bacterium]|jgi:hypothetical protein|nr:MafI family immunity protein [Burkholderiales bacterium]